MGKQQLQQKNEQNLSPLQIQFLNLLQIPVVSIEKRIKEELEENPALEEEEEEDNEDESLSIFNNLTSNYKATDYTSGQIEDKEESLSNHLTQQLVAINITDTEKFLVNYLINSLDYSGFLTRDINSVISDLLINNQIKIEQDELIKSLNILKQFDPIGVGAKNLQECLLIQLKELFPKNKNAYLIVKDYYTAFTNKNFEHILKNINININELKEIYLIIESLNPIPGNGFSSSNIKTEYIIPDFTILIKDNKPDLLLNKQRIKPIRVSKYYTGLLEEINDKETTAFLKQKIEKAKWFRDALLKREKTLKKVMSAIIKLQENFFMTGNEKDLKPMKLADVSQVVKMDISTISRVSNSKYVETHFGTFKLKELFSEAYRKDNGEIISTKEIKISLKEIIDTEDKNHPFTDENLSNLLGEKEYHIARRTVAKYREALGIQTAKLRRKIK